MINFRDLVKAGVHFGHQKTRWCPKMAPYIWGIKNNTHLIDVSKTAFQLEKAARFLEQIASQGKPILWLGTKKAAKEAIQRAGAQTGMPYVSHRWIGGTLSNFSQVKKSVTKCLHLEDVLSKTEKFPHYTKKELNMYQKVAGRLEKNIGGIKKLTWPIGALVVVDVFKEQSAIREAVKVGVPVVALVDTNCDPTLIDYVIPTNDDAPRAINLIIDFLIAAVNDGKAAIKKSRTEEIEEILVVEESKKTAPKKKAATTAKNEKTVEKAPVKKTAAKKEAAPKKSVAAKKESKKEETDTTKKEAEKK